MSTESRRAKSVKAGSFTESVIREMTRLSDLHGAINLGQGFPDFPAPFELKEAASRAIAEDYNQYPVTWGDPEFREAIALTYRRRYGMDVDPERDVCVTCGSTEAMIATMLGLVDAGDEVVIFEPFYENYGPDVIITGAAAKVVQLHAPDWTLDEAELEAAFGDRTRAIVLNSPNNPTGKVFSRDELEAIAKLCVKWDAVAITDEIYEHITFDGREHIPIATIDGMQDRTVTISALSKTYAVTGWRVGWTVADERLTAGIRVVHDFLTVAAAAPLQRAGIAALKMPQPYYDRMKVDYAKRRDVMLSILADAGFEARSPEGAYYVMADIGHLGFEDDTKAALHLVEQVGVATVPGSSFFSNAADGRRLLRFAFPKKLETLEAAGDRLREFARSRA